MVGEGVPSLFKVGTPVSFSNFGCYREYMVVKAKGCVPIPSAKPEFLPLLVSATTASLALECVGDMKSGETVLVTAAAGGTGQFAVQLAKLAGNHVIGTCSTSEKVEFLKSLGCDRVINYKTENVFEVLKQEYPKGIDLVYESIGGTMFDTCVNNLAIKGRLIIIGMISGYQDGTAWEAKGDKSRTPLAAKLLAKSASVRGFFLNHYWDKYPQHLQQLARLVSEGKLISHVDASRPFVGIESVADAVDYMYSGKNVGKVVVAMHPDVPHPAHKKAHL
ncbi:Prostaglandin reductase 3 [Balamuthia mandrillaris]